MSAWVSRRRPRSRRVSTPRWPRRQEARPKRLPPTALRSGVGVATAEHLPRFQGGIGATYQAGLQAALVGVPILPRVSLNLAKSMATRTDPLTVAPKGVP